jgi:hypothetical protein
MPPRGRPPLTEDVLRDRTSAYCKRYGVTELNQDGLPAYPAGKRESRQHRDWVNLLKAWSRFRRRTAAPEDPDRAAALRVQKALCPICLKKLDVSEATEAPVNAHRETPLVHSACNEVLRLVGRLGPPVIDRLTAYFWPEPPTPSEGRTHIKTR